MNETLHSKLARLLMDEHIYKVEINIKCLVGYHAERTDEILLQPHMRMFRIAKERGDKVAFVDGKHVFDGRFKDGCTTDGCHPNDLGFYRFARVQERKQTRIYHWLVKVGDWTHVGHTKWFERITRGLDRNC